MSIYTTQVRFICETAAGYTESQDGTKISEIITKAAPKIFDFDFPMWDEAYRQTLEEKILRTYYTREICEETVVLWKLRLETKLNNIMPYYNQLYKTTVLEFNPLYDVDYTKTHEGKGTETGDRTTSETGKNTTTQTTTGNVTNNGTEGVETNNNTTDTNNNLIKVADTPQNSVSSVTGLSTNWLSQVTQQEGNGTNKLTGSQNTTTQNTQKSDGSLNETVDTTRSGTDKNEINSTDEYIEHIAGKMGTGSYSKAIAEVRANIINIDLLLISELQDLFFGLWH